MVGLLVQGFIYLSGGTSIHKSEVYHALEVVYYLFSYLEIIYPRICIAIAKLAYYKDNVRPDAK